MKHTFAIITLILIILKPTSFANCRAGKMTKSGGELQYCDGTNMVSIKKATTGGCTIAGKTRATANDILYCDGASEWSLKGSALGSACAVNGKTQKNGTGMSVCLSGQLYSMISLADCEVRPYNGYYVPQNWCSINPLMCAAPTQFSAGDTFNYNYYILSGGVLTAKSAISTCSGNHCITTPDGLRSDGSVGVVCGACGTAHDASVTNAPSTAAELCSTGTATAVAGTGPWTWSCTGSGGGMDSSCATSSCNISAYTGKITGYMALNGLFPGVTYFVDASGNIKMSYIKTSPAYHPGYTGDYSYNNNSDFTTFSTVCNASSTCSCTYDNPISHTKHQYALTGDGVTMDGILDKGNAGWCSGLPPKNPLAHVYSISWSGPTNTDFYRCNYGAWQKCNLNGATGVLTCPVPTSTWSSYAGRTIRFTNVAGVHLDVHVTANGFTTSGSNNDAYTCNSMGVDLMPGYAYCKIWCGAPNPPTCEFAVSIDPTSGMWPLVSPGVWQ